ncbi:hypothetical protein [Streptomyces sp. NPDC048419]|uniref:hypothetical protein n=1 Tax=Streptomyces sp. NPDC048419 TaxID=3365547 RepID=UPI003716F3A9
MSESKGANDLFAEVERLAALREPPVRKQHVVSRAVLKQFAERHPCQGLYLLSVDLDYPQRSPARKGPKGCGVEEVFVAFASQETRMQDAPAIGSPCCATWMRSAALQRSAPHAVCHDG